VLPKIPSYLLELYKPLSGWESFYLRARWRLCPYEVVESLLPKRGKILDLGCGYGLLANLIASKSRIRTVVGVDLNDSRVRVAKRSTKSLKNVSFHSYDVERFEITQFDAIVITDVLHHVNNTKIKIILERISCGLCRNGTLAILDVATVPFWKFCISYLVDRSLNPTSRLYFRSDRQMRNLLQKFSLTVEKTIEAHKKLLFSDVIYLCKKERD